MQLFWIAALISVSTAVKHIVTEVGNADTEAVPYKLNLAAYFTERETSQAMLWDISGESFSFYLMPKEHCQEVWLCSTGQSDISKINPKKLDGACKSFTRFRPMEGTVTAKLDATNQGVQGETRVYPWTKVFLQHEQAKKYRLKVAKEDRDNDGNVDQTKLENMEVEIDGVPLILTSSPYCQPILQSSHSGRPVNSVALKPKDFQLAFPTNREDNIFFEKKFNGLLIPTVVETYETGKLKTQCPPIWLSEFEPTEKNWPVTDENKEKTRHMIYTFHRRTPRPTEPTCDTHPEWRSSFKLIIDDPKMCTWIRLCFLEDGKTLCSDPKKSVELLLAYKLFVGVDSDQARSLDVPFDDLRAIRFDLNKVGGKVARLTMSHSFASDEGGVKHHMSGKHLEKWLTEDSFQVSLARDKHCRARLAMDHLLESDNKGGKQCLSLKECHVVKPIKYAPFRGSDSLKMTDFHPV